MTHRKFLLLWALLILLMFPIAHALFWIWLYTFDGEGTAQKNTEHFEIRSSELLFDWEYTPHMKHPESTVFSFYVYQKDGENYIDFVRVTGNETTSGKLKIHDVQRGTYYIRLNVVDTYRYRIRVFEDMDMRPENITGRYLMTIFAIVAIVFLTPIGAVLLFILRRARKRRKTH